MQMSKLKIKDVKNSEKGSVDVPSQFNEEVRPDLVGRAVLAIASHKRQPYGADPEAGKKSSAELSRRRRKYRGSYGFGISRVTRKILSRNGTRLNWVGAFSPGTVGGRRAHPPKSEKVWSQDINKKERQKAIRSAMAATLDAELVGARGHEVPEGYPFAISDDFQAIIKSKDFVSALDNLGLKEELERCSQKKIRAGKGKGRGRPYNRKKGPLVVVGGQCPLEISGSNVPGVDVVRVAELNAELLAPGADLGRMTLFTESAINELSKHNLFFPKLKMLKEKVKVPSGNDSKKKGVEKKGKEVSSSKEEPKRAPVKKESSKKSEDSKAKKSEANK